MGVGHGGFHIAVAKQFLNRKDVGALFQKVCGKRMAEGVSGRWFADPCCIHGWTHGALHETSSGIRLPDQSAGLLAGAACAGAETPEKWTLNRRSVREAASH